MSTPDPGRRPLASRGLPFGRPLDLDLHLCGVLTTVLPRVPLQSPPSRALCRQISMIPFSRLFTPTPPCSPAR